MERETKIIVSLGSNTNQMENLDFAKKKLCVILGKDARFTECLWTEPVGIESDRFLNCLCVAMTRHSQQQLLKAFKHLERQCSRTRKNDKNNRITLDIDLMLYGEEKFHHADWDREYIKKLMRGVDDGTPNYIIDPTLNK